MYQLFRWMEFHVSKISMERLKRDTFVYEKTQNISRTHLKPSFLSFSSQGLDKDIKIWMPSNEDFEINREELEKCVLSNMKNQIEAGKQSTFSLDPAIIQLARRFFQRQQQQRGEASSPNPLQQFIYRSSDDSSSS